MLAECAAADQKELGEADVGLTTFFERIAAGERGRGEFDQFSQVAKELAAGLLAGEARQCQGFLACAGNQVEKLFEGGEGFADGIREWALQPLAQLV